MELRNLKAELYLLKKQQDKDRRDTSLLIAIQTALLLIVMYLA